MPCRRAIVELFGLWRLLWKCRWRRLCKELAHVGIQEFTFLVEVLQMFVDGRSCILNLFESFINASPHRVQFLLGVCKVVCNEVVVLSLGLQEGCNILTLFRASPSSSSVDFVSLQCGLPILGFRLVQMVVEVVEANVGGGFDHICLCFCLCQVGLRAIQPCL